MTSYALNKTEIIALKYILMQRGLTEKEAFERINNIRYNLRELIVKLNQQKKSKTEIKTKFYEEFAKLCEEHE